MANISSSIQTVDILKLKNELESLVDAQGRSIFRVVNIIPKTESTLTQVELTLTNGNPDLDQTQLQLAQTTIDAHQNLQKLRVLIQDLPNINDAASNRLYVDVKVSELVDSAPNVLDTLNELASALNNDQNFATTVATRFSSIENRIDQLELGGLGTISGSGTINYVPKFVSAQVIGNSLLVDTGSAVGIGKSNPAKLLDIAGDILVNGITVGKSSGTQNTVLGLDALKYNATGNENTAIGYQSLFSNDSGYKNTALGNYSLNKNISGYANVAVGSSTLQQNTTGYGNIALGDESLLKNTQGAGNIAIGSASLNNNTTGYNNIAIGIGAMVQNVSGILNIALGNSALGENKANANIAVGHETLRDNTTGYYNVAVGSYALRFNTTGNKNVAFGTSALYKNTYGNENVAMGNESLYENTSGYWNNAFGSYALRFNTTGNKNVAFGTSALYKNTYGNENVAMGNESLYENTSGYWNNAFGSYALRFNTTGNKNVAFGTSALYKNTYGNENVAIGQESLYENTSGSSNTGIGSYALRSNTTGTYNTAIGTSASQSNTTGEGNTSVGFESLRQNTTGLHNTSVGLQALRNNTTGSLNTALGMRALNSNTTGEGNTSVGWESLLLNTTGLHNTSVGAQALRNTTTGFENTALGMRALNYNTIGSANVAIGLQSLQFNTEGEKNIAIGRSALQQNATGIGNIAIGEIAAVNHTNGIKNIFIGCEVGNSFQSGNYNVIIGGNNGASISGTDRNIIISDGEGNIRIQSNSTGNTNIVGSLTLNGVQILDGGQTTSAISTAINNIADASQTQRGFVNTTSQTFAGTKTFTNTIQGSISGNAASATKLQTARSINGKLFDGTADLTIDTAIAHSIQFNSSGTGDASGTSFNALADVAVSYNTIGAAPLAHSHSASDITSGTLSVVRGGTGASTEQTAINTLSQVSSATTGQVLTKDSNGNAVWQTPTGFNAVTDGIESAPGIAFLNDQNTGIYRPGVDIIAFSTSGAERARINNYGYFGVGTSSENPHAPITGHGYALNWGTLAGVDNTAFASGVGGTLSLAGQYNSSTSPAIFGQLSAIKENATSGDYKGAVVVRTNSGATSTLTQTERLRVTSDGRLGVGTTTPGAFTSLVNNNSSLNTLALKMASGQTLHQIVCQDSSGTAHAEIGYISGTTYQSLRATAPNTAYNVISINNTSGAQMQIYSTGNTSSGINVVTAHPFIVSTNSTERLRVDAAGKVNIGTVSDLGGKLNVAGDILQTGNLTIRNDSPTIYLRDTSNRSSMIHCNSNLLYFLRGSGIDSSVWEQYNGAWPLVINLENNQADFGGNISVAYGNITTSGFVLATPSSPDTVAMQGTSQSSYMPVTNVYATNVSYTGVMLNVVADRPKSSGFRFLNCYSDNATAANSIFRLRGDGNGYADGSWLGGGADYAEYFEWLDGNLNEEDRRGFSVVIENGKIRKAEAQEDPIGVISVAPAVVGDSAWNNWSKKYLKDEFGSDILEDYVVASWTDGEGKEHNVAVDNVPENLTVPVNATLTTQKRQKLNPDWIPSLDYVPREDRKEWSMVGLIGKLRIRKGQPTGSRWIKLRDISENVEEWLVR